MNYAQISDNIDKIRLFFRRDKEPFLRLYNILGFYPHNTDIYHVALMHRSCRNDGGRRTKHINNERLEFLGDALLSAVVADVLYARYQNQQEGFLTTLRSKIVKRETLNELAVQIGLDKLVMHSDHVNSSHNSYMNGNAFEAFFAAIYLDRGYDYCMRFMKEQIFAKYIDIEKMSRKEENYKSKLIEWCQHYQCQFDFVVTNEKIEGGNAPKFYSEVRIEGVVCGNGTGYSKKESHQDAAEAAYKKVSSNVGFVNKLIEIRNARVGSPRREAAANEQPDAAKAQPSVKAPQQKAQAPKPAKPATVVETKPEAETEPPTAKEKPVTRKPKSKAKPRKADAEPQNGEVKPQKEEVKPQKEETKPRKEEPKPQKEEVKPQKKNVDARKGGAKPAEAETNATKPENNAADGGATAENAETKPRTRSRRAKPKTPKAETPEQ